MEAISAAIHLSCILLQTPHYYECRWHDLLGLLVAFAFVLVLLFVGVFIVSPLVWPHIWRDMLKDLEERKERRQREMNEGRH
jgi:uncharacterized protein YjeT (DUF2065 family)